VSFTISVGTTTATVTGPLDLSLPVVILLHGLSGTSGDMTAPATARPGLAYDLNATYPPYSDAGFHFIPPLVPVQGVFLDAAVTTLTSWRDALNAAGFTTVDYSQSGPTIAADAAQLAAIAIALAGDQRLAGMRFAIVGHSRGGLVARAFLTTSLTNAALAGFMARMTTLVTLHSPNTGSGLANLSVTVDGLLASVQAAFSGAGLTPPPFLATLRAMVTSPAIAELAVGSATLAGIAAMEPVPGVVYRTFGGTSTHFVRLWANVFTPDSSIPLPVPWPWFHWGTSPLQVGDLLDPLTFLPIAVLGGVPLVAELITALTELAATTPELQNGAGDVLVTDAHARLTFEASHGTNPIDHAEALWDAGLQAQVLAILIQLRVPTITGHATARLNPLARTGVLTTYTVTAADALTGAALTSGTVTVRDTFDVPVITVPLGQSFQYDFKRRRVCTVEYGPNGHPVVTCEDIWPSVDVVLGAPYGTVDVDTGLP
jgi:pimeloyl-ACP methyl ester carboxylesterase